MKEQQIDLIIDNQRKFFESGATLNVDFRIEALKKLQNALIKNEDAIASVLQADLGKSPEESYMCETGIVLSEIGYMLRHIRRFAREATVVTPLAQFASRSYRKPMPYGVTLIMSPWNYPLMLALDPLVNAIAAGNTVILKPSAYSPATSNFLKDFISNLFPEEYVAVVVGGREENAYLLEKKFNYIFFTGSKNVGKLVLQKAANHLTPVTLELGGKSPCIIDKSAKIELAAKRIVFGKFLNCGQTCVAPDYVLCHHSVKDQFIKCLTEEIQKQYGTDCLRNPLYGKIISSRHFDRITKLVDPHKVIHGGRWDADSLKIEPTVMDHVTWEDAVMNEEIFGPILPILAFEEIDYVIETVRQHDKPLALYIFAENSSVIQRVTSRCSFGGGCVNDCVIHIATSHMPFGGIGESGMGSYHGKNGFETFSHYKSIVDKKTWMDLPMRYQPYSKLGNWLIHLFLR